MGPDTQINFIRDHKMMKWSMYICMKSTLEFLALRLCAIYCGDLLKKEAERK